MYFSDSFDKDYKIDMILYKSIIFKGNDKYHLLIYFGCRKKNVFPTLLNQLDEIYTRGFPGASYVKIKKHAASPPP